MIEGIRVSGLTKLERLELAEFDGVDFSEEALNGDAHGEVTVFTALIAVSAISALAAWLLRRHDYQRFEETVEVVHADGRFERHAIRWEGRSVQAPEAELVRQIRGDLRLPE